MELKTSKITIRPYKISDVDDFMIYAGDEKVTKFTWWNTFKSKEEALRYIEETCIPHPFCRSICLDDRSIGYISITPGSGDGICRADVAYALAAEYWGQGIVARALKIAISDVIKDFPDLVRLQALVAVGNKASQRVLEKFGFFREGLLRKYVFHKGETRDLIIYSLLYTDPIL